MRAPPLFSRSSNKAAALIIVLAFVVLVTGLALAYFTRTTTDRQLAQSSYNDTSADLLARSALDIVVGDFKQEIVNGSSIVIPTPGTTTIYVPTPAANVIPVYSPSPAPSPAILNLIRRSVRGDTSSGANPVPSPAVGSRASAVNSRADVSANGRYITSTRWNSHYLIPKGSPATSDSSPIPAFDALAPDWVIVTRAGPAPFDSWNTALADPTSSNYAIGRYAYAVYDEGGLLDANAVGYPTPAATPIPGSQFLRKGVPAFDDVNVVVATPTPVGTPFMTELVGFRNYATLRQGGASNLSFPVPAPLAGPGVFPNTAVDSFFNYVLGSATLQPHVGTSTDYATVNPVVATDQRTDQRFVTRAELINLVKTLGNAGVSVNVNALQYMGTFSREQNKPNVQLTTEWPFTRVVLPQRFSLGNLNLVVYPSPTPTPIVTPTPTATPTLTPTIQTAFGLQFASANTPPPATPTPTPTWGPCDSQVRWEYVGNQGTPNPAATPLSAIPAFPSDLRTLDFFQYINYALFGDGVITNANPANMPFTLGIGAALIDQYDAENQLITGIYYGGTGTPCPLDTPIPNACLVYGVEYGVSGSGIGTLGPRWYVLPSCIDSISPMPTPTPDSSPAGGGPPNINSPTRSVGEFGWAYSILNAANGHNINPQLKYLIDFKDAYDSANNPDPALLDFFTYNSAPVRSGIVSLNTRQAPVLAAILNRTIYQGLGGSILNLTQAMDAANSIVTTTAAQPAQSRADIARIASVVNPAVAPFNTAPITQDKEDTIARALSEVTQTRTWGFLIDVVAQTGHYKANTDATYCTTHNCLGDQFVVEGEKRYWLHIAIDRFDGSIVGQQLEEVTE